MDNYPGLDRLFPLEWAAQFTRTSQSWPPSVTADRPGVNLPCGAERTPPPSNHPPPAVRKQVSDPNKANGRYHLHYSVEWRVELDTKIIATQSEANVVVSPSSYWRHVLKSRLDQVVRQRLAGDQRARHDRTTVVVSVTDPGQPDITKEYAGSEINWAVADKQLLDWRPHCREGKPLHVSLLFQFVAPNPQSVPGTATTRGDEGSQVSGSGPMPTPRRWETVTEPTQQGRPPFLYDLCVFMRCPTSCERGPFCWVNSRGVHHRMAPESFKLLEAHVTHHGMPATHDDVPFDLQRQLIMDRQAQASSPGPAMPLNISNAVTGQHQPKARTHRQRQTPSSTSTQTPTSGIRVGQCESSLGRRSDVAGPKPKEATALGDDALRAYTTWQQSRVPDPSLKAEFRKAFDVAARKGLSLDLLYQNRNLQIFIAEGVPEGVAWYFCRPQEIDIFRDWKRRVSIRAGMKMGEDETRR